MTRRKSIRLANYDYSSAGAYFVTICSYRMSNVFGHIRKSTVCLNKCGKILRTQILKTQQVRRDVTIDSYVIMPNHVHILLFIKTVGATRRVAPTRHSSTLHPSSLGSIIGQIKSNTTRMIHRLPGRARTKVWQRNYFDHIIRDEASLNRHREYIFDNPRRWIENQHNNLD
jgi:REP element-mobilizing transposase RayT